MEDGNDGLGGSTGRSLTSISALAWGRGAWGGRGKGEGRQRGRENAGSGLCIMAFLGGLQRALLPNMLFSSQMLRNFNA